ncbi:hypothetical protein GDO81_006075 [Engystomops pustulosus]|uniref:Uncharacterized protein n=1 Tax=Engystomops pustulosus TaxID=76066 RepID=A0AAV7CUE0_ENGPU|nr:hypothetical protein GDO81_006075 [Engystomops pustulosus]
MTSSMIPRYIFVCAILLAIMAVVLGKGPMGTNRTVAETNGTPHVSAMFLVILTFSMFHYILNN